MMVECLVQGELDDDGVPGSWVVCVVPHEGVYVGLMTNAGVWEGDRLGIKHGGEIELTLLQEGEEVARKEITDIDALKTHVTQHGGYFEQDSSN